MCWALYLASDKELPLIPWEKASPAFNTTALSEADISVKSQFSLRNVIYLGSYQGCGCGFMPADEDEPKDIANRAATVQALSCYLDNALLQATHLEMFLCWEGDQTQSPVSKKVVFPQDFLVEEFPLAEKEFAKVVMHA